MEAHIIDVLRGAMRPIPTRVISAAIGTDPATVSEMLNRLADTGVVNAYELAPSRVRKHSRFGWMLGLDDLG